MNNRIKVLIKALEIKKVDFARRLNISQSFVSDMCSGKSKPSDRTILDICREFNVSEKWLRTGEGEMFNQSVENTVDRLCTEFHASELESRIIRAYFRIDPRIREPFMQRMIQEIQVEYAASAPSAAKPDKAQTTEQKMPTPVSEDGPKSANENLLMRDVAAMNPGRQEHLLDQYNQARMLRERQKDASSASVPPVADDKAPESEPPDQSQ